MKLFVFFSRSTGGGNVAEGFVVKKLGLLLDDRFLTIHKRDCRCCIEFRLRSLIYILNESLGKTPFLTPVYFRPEVLRKYYDAPQRYKVETGYLRCVGLWGIPFERRTDDLVQVWLGDLGQIPHIDQRHWRTHCVQPPGTGISEARFRRDFGA